MTFKLEFRIPPGTPPVHAMKGSSMKFVKPPEKPKANILLCGRPKSGKTIGASSAPPGVLYLNFDLPNATRQAHLRHPDGSILEPEIPPFTEGARPLFSFMMEVTRELQKPSQAMVETVVVDTVGELYRRLLEEFSNRAVRPSLPTYGEVSVQVERFCRGLCMVQNVNTVLCCHDLVVQNGDETVFIPFTGTRAGSSDLGAKLESMVDILGYTNVIETPAGKQGVAQLIPLKGRNGGDRFDCLGDWRPLDISEWMETIEKHEKGEPIQRFDLSANVGTNESEPEKPEEQEAPKTAEKPPPARRPSRKAA